MTAQGALKAWLHEHGKSQSWLAANTGYTESHVSRVMRGHEAPSDKFRFAAYHLTGLDAVKDEASWA